MTLSTDVQAAHVAALDFWIALSDDEADEAILARVTPSARRTLAGLVGLARYIREELLGIELESIGLLGTFDQIEQRAGGLLRFRFSRAGRFARLVGSGDPSPIWRLDLEQHEGRWLVDPIRTGGGALLEMLSISRSMLGRGGRSTSWPLRRTCSARMLGRSHS
jgi:hypothetical protein